MGQTTKYAKVKRPVSKQGGRGFRENPGWTQTLGPTSRWHLRPDIISGMSVGGEGVKKMKRTQWKQV